MALRSNCVCGNSYGTYGMALDSKCNVPCNAKTAEICGGTLTNSIYATGLKPLNSNIKKNYFNAQIFKWSKSNYLINFCAKKI